MINEYLTEGAISAETIMKTIAAEQNNFSSGAQSIFLGQVRQDANGNKSVSKILYSAYPEMVKNQADTIKADILRKFTDINTIIIIHSIGEIKPGEISLFVNVSGGHRKEATEACSAIVNMVKEKLPVWKQEFFDDLTYHWPHN